MACSHPWIESDKLPFTHKLFNSLLEAHTGSYQLEVDLSFILLLANCLEENDGTVDVDLG